MPPQLPLTELELLELWCEGSAIAGDLLLRRCAPLLRRFFADKVGEAADDLVQQTLIGCTRHREKIRESGALRLYLFKIARCRLWDHLRAVQRRGARIDDDAAPPAPPPRFARERGDVREAVTRLPLALQAVTMLHYWEGLSTVEIATLLDVAQGTVKSRLRRAREALALELRV